MRKDEREKRTDGLKEIRGEIYPPAPLGDHGEEGTTARADEDDKNGADPQVEMGVCSTTAAAIWVFSNSKHFYADVWEGRDEGGDAIGQDGVFKPDTLEWIMAVGWTSSTHP